MVSAGTPPLAPVPALDTPTVTATTPAGAGGPASARLSLEEQWGRLSGVIGGAVSRADAILRLQASAGHQIDSAAYALQGLMGELGAVMSLPALPKQAEVLSIEHTAARAYQTAIAA